MRKILFDLAATQGYGRTKFHGGGEYAKRVFRACVEQCPKDLLIEAHLDPSRFTDPQINEFMKRHEIRVHYITSAHELGTLLEKNEYDRYYSALPIDARWDFDIPATTQFVYTLHGVRGMLTRDWRLRTKYEDSVLRGIAITTFLFLLGRWWNNKILQRYRRKIEVTSNREIFTVSNYGKYGFIGALPDLDLSDMIVLDSVAEDAIPNRDNAVLSRANLEGGQFFLLVSANRYEKNAYRALLALDRYFTMTESRDSVARTRVAVTGLSRESRLVRSLKLKNASRFEFLDYVTPGEMEELYASAYALMYPSLSEGYGYPPVQAMRYGTPSLCAGGTSIPEVCASAAIYFNPYDVDEMIARIFEVSDDAVRVDLLPKVSARGRILRLRQDFALERIVATLVG